MYQTFVISTFIKETLFVVAPIFFFALIYWGAGLYKEEYRGCALATLGLFWGGLLALIVWDSYPFLYDCIQYLRQGDAYVQDATCRLEQVTSGTTIGFFLAQEHLHCQGGVDFISRYRRDLQRVLWRWAKEQRVLRIRYLPRSRLVLELTPVDSR
ncbi:MAG: hypothetical protein ACPLTQ_09530 [Anaerolineae bacterium]|jgi:hypothetical protein